MKTKSLLLPALIVVVSFYLLGKNENLPVSMIIQPEVTESRPPSVDEIWEKQLQKTVVSENIASKPEKVPIDTKVKSIEVINSIAKRLITPDELWEQQHDNTISYLPNDTPDFLVESTEMLEQEVEAKARQLANTNSGFDLSEDELFDELDGNTSEQILQLKSENFVSYNIYDNTVESTEMLDQEAQAKLRRFSKANNSDFTSPEYGLPDELDRNSGEQQLRVNNGDFFSSDEYEDPVESSQMLEQEAEAKLRQLSKGNSSDLK